MKKFIYVFNSNDKDKMLAAGYELLQSDTKNDIYVFINKPNETFALLDISTIESDVLSF